MKVASFRKPERTGDTMLVPKFAVFGDHLKAVCAVALCLGLAVLAFIGALADTPATAALDRKAHV